MKDIHWHFSVENIIVYGLSAVIFINLGRIAAGTLVERGGRLKPIGEAIGALL